MQGFFLSSGRSQLTAQLDSRQQLINSHTAGITMKRLGTEQIFTTASGGSAEKYYPNYSVEFVP